MNKMNYLTYQSRLNALMKDEKLQKLGIKKAVLASTKYLYDIDYLTVGYGKYDIFLVGGTHGSEVIGPDFLLELIRSLPSLKGFDPNLYTLKILPLQNPEGYDITTNTLKNISLEDFPKKSYEYYLRYRTDMIIHTSLLALTDLFSTLEQTTSENLLKQIKSFVRSNSKWACLSQDRVFPKIEIFNHDIQKITKCSTFLELYLEMVKVIEQTKEKISIQTIHDEMLIFFLQQLKENLFQLFQKKTIFFPKRLFQEMFRDSLIEGLYSKNLEQNVREMFQFYQHPLGSQIQMDANGSGVNLNANTPFNPGFSTYSKEDIIYGPNPKGNIRKYVPGPIGMASAKEEVFLLEKENMVLENLIQDSIQKNRYLMTLLYHASGGMIYYQPYEGLMDEKKYLSFLKYNYELAFFYSQKTSYQMLERSDKTGYGDYLRRTYPGVLMIELSKMGGNPIGPYGDVNNIAKVFSENIQAVDSVMLNSKIKMKKQRKEW